MAREPKNSGKHSVDQKAKRLRQLVKENTPTRVTGLKLGRTAEGIRSNASGANVSLKPTNQSSYSRRNN